MRNDFPNGNFWNIEKSQFVFLTSKRIVRQVLISETGPSEIRNKRISDRLFRYVVTLRLKKYSRVWFTFPNSYSNIWQNDHSLLFFIGHYVYMVKRCYTDWNLCNNHSNTGSILLSYTWLIEHWSLVQNHIKESWSIIIMWIFDGKDSEKYQVDGLVGQIF